MIADDHQRIGTGPLQGLRVVEAGMNVAGPIAASILADLGATVIKVEPPTGDTTRQLAPQVEDASAIFAMANHDKRLVCLDLRSDGGRSVLAALIADADVIVHNLRPGKSAGLGLDTESCHQINPRLVHGAITAFHLRDGDRPGYDLLVQAESGIMDLTGPRDGPPSRLPGTMIDQVAGLWLAQGILAALHGPRDSVAIEVALIDVAVWLLGERATSYLVSGVAPRRFGSSTEVTTPHGAYRASDGDLVIGAASDGLFARLADVLGPSVADDDRFRTQQDRLAHREELDLAISAVLATAPVDEWLERFGGAGVPSGRLQSLPDALATHEAHSATGLARSPRTPKLGLLAPPIQMSHRSWGVIRATGPIGRDTHTVLAELGFDVAQRVELQNNGTLGPSPQA